MPANTAAGGPYPSLDEVVNDVADLRPLGSVATRILQITEGGRFSAQELARVIAADQALAAKMLRLANSAYYGFPRRISTVRDAVVLLGFRAVRSATLASCVIDAMEGTNLLDYREFWHFSVTVGMLAELPARDAGAHRDEAFTAGVMHNVGLLALDQQLAPALRDCLEQASRARVDLHDAERAVLGFTDAELGGALALHWNFPEQLITAVASHSLPPEQIGDPRSLASHVMRARAFARSYGLRDGIARPETPDPEPQATVIPLSASLDSEAVDGLLGRVDAFLESALN